MRRCLVSLVASVAVARVVPAQEAEFEAVSIRRNTSGMASPAGIRSLPDGTWIVTNEPISSVIRLAAPIPVREVAGLPDWANTEPYDIVAKPPAGATRQQVAAMWRTTFAQRMNLSAHIEDREVGGFALVVANSDGRLGPRLKPAPPECTPASDGTGGAAPVPPPPSSRCGLSFGDTRIEAVGVTMDALVQSLSSLAGGLVVNRTGLNGAYELQLDFEPPGLRATDGPRPADMPPDVFTAVREQLGLRLRPEKIRAPVFVVDSIQRPSEN